jgi:16S rRNA (cytosine1402-N4)-methyltransferase
MTTSNSYHIPVLLHAAIEGLKIKPDGIYVDATFGGGGHSHHILQSLTTGKLYAFDQDADAAKNVTPHPNLIFIPQNFRHLQASLESFEVEKADGILADLGVSSHQFDDPQRGFSIRTDAKLDMRMDQSQEFSAWNIINEWEPEEIKKILREGEVENAGKLAFRITQQREKKSIETTGELIEIIKRTAPRQKEKQYQAVVFQAIRMEVNGELDALKKFLQQCETVLNPGGRLVVIAYHSLEDRLVKNFLRSGNFQGEVQKDFYGNPLKPFREITRKPIVPDTAETEQNPRSRSARLRIAEKIE